MLNLPELPTRNSESEALGLRTCISNKLAGSWAPPHLGAVREGEWTGRGAVTSVSFAIGAAVSPPAQLTQEPRSHPWKDEKRRSLHPGAGAEVSQEAPSRRTGSHAGWLLGRVCPLFHCVVCAHVSVPLRMSVCMCGHACAKAGGAGGVGKAEIRGRPP